MIWKQAYPHRKISFLNFVFQQNEKKKSPGLKKMCIYTLYPDWEGSIFKPECEKRSRNTREGKISAHVNVWHVVDFSSDISF